MSGREDWCADGHAGEPDEGCNSSVAKWGCRRPLSKTSGMPMSADWAHPFHGLTVADVCPSSCGAAACRSHMLLAAVSHGNAYAGGESGNCSKLLEMEDPERKDPWRETCIEWLVLLVPRDAAMRDIDDEAAALRRDIRAGDAASQRRSDAAFAAALAASDAIAASAGAIAGLALAFAEAGDDKRRPSIFREIAEMEEQLR
eukprot:gene20043-45831_t